MATYNKHYQFVEDLCHGVHNFTATTGDTLTAYLCAPGTPPVVWDSVLTDLSAKVISYTGLSSRLFPTATRSSSQASGLYTLLLADLTLTASATVADFQTIGIYNEDTTTPTDALICWWDYGSTVSMVDTDTFKIDFTTSTFTIPA